MGKFILNKIPKQERIKLIGRLYDAINCAEDREELRLILRDLLTPDEIGMLAKRIEVALALMEEKTYQEIVNELKVGRDKIRKVKQSLSVHGQGYRIIAKRMESKSEK